MTDDAPADVLEPAALPARLSLGLSGLAGAVRQRARSWPTC